MKNSIGNIQSFFVRICIVFSISFCLTTNAFADAPEWRWQLLKLIDEENALVLPPTSPLTYPVSYTHLTLPTKA